MKIKAQSTPLACIILAAGKGTRMRSTLPKVMHAVAHRPMLLHVVETAQAMQSERIIVVTASEMADIRERINEDYGNKVQNVIQTEQRGTGDAVKSAQTAMRNFNGIVLILYGDTPLIRPETLTKMSMLLNENTHMALVVLGMEVSSPNEYGKLIRGGGGELDRIVEARDAQGDEKTATLCNSGVMAVRGTLLFPLLAQLNTQNAKGEYYLTDIVALARKAGHTCGIATAEAAELQGINSRAELAKAEASLQERLRAQAMADGVTFVDPASVFLSCDTRLGQDVIIEPHVVFGPRVEVGDNVRIRAFCHIEGTKIHSHAVIGPFARLRPGTVIGARAHIGNFVEVKQATIGSGAKANHLSYVGDTDVGENANIGAGAITANYNGFAKHRTVVGKGASIGSNAVLVAPVTVGDGAIVGAGSVITEDVESDALALTRTVQKQKIGWARAFRNRKKH